MKKIALAVFLALTSLSAVADVSCSGVERAFDNACLTGGGRVALNEGGGTCWSQNLRLEATYAQLDGQCTIGSLVITNVWVEDQALVTKLSNELDEQARRASFIESREKFESGLNDTGSSATQEIHGISEQSKVPKAFAPMIVVVSGTQNAWITGNTSSVMHPAGFWIYDNTDGAIFFMQAHQAR